MKTPETMYRTVVWSILAGVCMTGLCSCARKEDQSTAPKPKPAEAGHGKAATVASDGDLVPIPLMLPKPMFLGAEFFAFPELTNLTGRARPPFLAPKGVSNVALGKLVRSSVGQPIIGQLSMITDGKKEATDDSLVVLDRGVQYISIDLERPCEIFAIVVWHYHKKARIYFDVVVQVADDPNFATGIHTLFNNDDDNSSGLGVGTDKLYIETYEGRLIDAKGVKAGYVRLSSKGNSDSDENHYLEVEVYGRPVK